MLHAIRALAVSAMAAGGLDLNAGETHHHAGGTVDRRIAHREVQYPRWGCHVGGPVAAGEDGGHEGDGKQQIYIDAQGTHDPYLLMCRTQGIIARAGPRTV